MGTEAWTMKCPNCGGYVQDGAMFCTACGAQTAPGPQGQWGAPPPPPPPAGAPQPGQQGPPPPYPYQQPYQYQPPPKETSSTVVKVVAIVIVVAVVLAVLMVAIFWMGVLSVIDDLPDDRVTLNLASPSVETREITNITHWDAVVNINKITPSDSRVMWLSVLVIVKAADGSVLLTQTVPMPDSPASYDDATNGWVDVEIWYIDVGSDMFLDSGDAMKITGMDDGYEGAWIEFTYLGNRIGSITLPTNFP